MHFGSLFLYFAPHGFLGGDFWVNCQLPAMSWKACFRAMRTVFQFGQMTPLTFHLWWLLVRSTSSGDVNDVGTEMGPDLCLRYESACTFSGHRWLWILYLHECPCPIDVCHVRISTHSTNKVRSEITSMASETEQAEESLLWVSVTCVILFGLALMCPPCVGLGLLLDFALLSGRCHILLITMMVPGT